MPRYCIYKCGEMDLNFFSRDVALYHFISGVIDLISSNRSDLLKPCCQKIYYLHINGTNVQNNYYKITYPRSLISPSYDCYGKVFLPF